MTQKSASRCPDALFGGAHQEGKEQVASWWLGGVRNPGGMVV